MTWKKTPTCAEWHVFQEVDDHNKKHHPIRFFFQDSVPTTWGQFTHRVSETKWWFIHRIHPGHRYHMLHTGLKPGYYDIPEVMIHSMFALIIRYVDGEKCFENINWESDPVHDCVAGEIEDLYYWWKNIRPLRDSIENALHKQTDSTGVFSKEPSSENNNKIYDELFRLEAMWDAEDMYNLKRLITIRKFLWT